MRRFVATLGVATIAGCAAAGGAPATTPATPSPGAAAERTTPPASLAAGRRVVESVCLACHSLAPPHKTAPPFSMIAARYVAATPDTAEAARRIVAWARDPDPARSLLPAHAIERYGLMAPLDLPEADLRNAAAYVVTLAAPGGGMGARRRQGGP